MNAGILTARLVLAAVFAVAGLAKLADRAGTRRALAEFGAPAPLTLPLAVLLPLAELTVAGLLLPAGSARLGAAGALALLLLFGIVISANLALGRSPDCHCFGQLHSAPAGLDTLVRNGALGAVGVLVLVLGPGSDLGEPFAAAGRLGAGGLALLAGGVALAGAVGLEGWLVLALLRQNGRLINRLDALEEALATRGIAPAPPTHPTQQGPAGLPVGAAAPSFALPDGGANVVSLDSLLSRGKPVLLVFSDPDCGPCAALAPEVAAWQREDAERLTVVLVTREQRRRRRVPVDGLTTTLFQSSKSEVAQAFQAWGTPSAVLVGRDATVGSPLAAGSEAIRTLRQQAAGRLRVLPLLHGDGQRAATVPIAPPQPGATAPALRLPDLGGTAVELRELRGREVVVAFWNPACSFCSELVPELRAMEGERFGPDRALVLVSSGSVESNRAMGLTSPVLLDQTLEVTLSYGVQGTPSAILIDPEGQVASELAVGAAAVLGLCRGDERPAEGDGV